MQGIMEMVSDELIGKIQHGENVSEQEWTQILDWLCLYQFAQKDNVNFWYVSHYLCEDALKIISDNPGRFDFPEFNSNSIRAMPPFMNVEDQPIPFPAFINLLIISSNRSSKNINAARYFFSHESFEE